MRQGDVVVTITWHTVPFRGDKFEEAWRPAAAAALDYGASYWSLLRGKDDSADFIQPVDAGELVPVDAAPA